MEWFVQLTSGEQLIALFAAAALVLLLWILFWLARLRDGQFREQTSLEARQLELENLLHEQERRLVREQSELRELLTQRIAQGALAQQDKLGELRESLAQSLVRHREAFDERQLETMRLQQEALQSGMAEVRKQVAEALVQKVLELAPYLPQDIGLFIMNTDHPDRLADLVSSFMNIPTADKQQLLETVDVLIVVTEALFAEVVGHTLALQSS